MYKVRETILRKLVILAVAGLGIAVTAQPASAEFLDFTVDEGTVPGTPANVFTADKINGAYSEILTFDAMGGFEATLFVNFSQYLFNEGGTPVALSFLTTGAIAPTQYGLYATYTASGTVTPLGGGDFRFNTTNANANIYIDPDNNTTKALPGAGGLAVILGGNAEDYLIMSASSVARENNIIDDGDGFFDIVFDDPTLTDNGTLQDGQSYWPTLPLVQFLLANVDGDFDAFVPAGTVTTSGDVSLVFRVPEPATLALLGLGFLGSAAAVRRRRKLDA